MTQRQMQENINEFASLRLHLNYIYAMWGTHKEMEDIREETTKLLVRIEAEKERLYGILRSISSSNS